MPAGTGVRFEPGLKQTVTLVPIGGSRRVVRRGRPRATGRSTRRRRPGSGARPRPRPRLPGSMRAWSRISRKAYAQIYGPTKGDLVRLGDTSLAGRDRARLHRLRARTARPAPARACATVRASRPAAPMPSGALDLVIQNATIIDAVVGIVKADIGIRDGRIVGIGKAGNPDVMPMASMPDLVVGPEHHGHSRRLLHRDRGRRRVPRPYPVPAAVRPRARGRHHHADRDEPGAALRRRQRRRPNVLGAIIQAPRTTHRLNFGLSRHAAARIRGRSRNRSRRARWRSRSTRTSAPPPR